LLSVARLDAAKRLDIVLRAVAACKELVELRVISDGPERERLERLADELGLRDRVRFLGRVPDEEVVRLYRACRAVVYIPIDEDYGYAAVEGLMAGKPILTATDSGGVREFVRDGENGAVLPPEPAALAAALDKWWRDPGAAARLGREAPKAVAEIGWERVVRELTR
jgi:glycosyltransferase involved in cell wall biosynthesis